ncbi:hypothetical protein NDU88_010564 [Pleurodeles waltl]|uniref:Uncharacterized protein n=1 Tax=Pleurodeles waltl TaxID=8319 RepID=A0AAV7PV84_PLEWA|nr:hypothetical protein NDU88_010564 [Pleurodeles waltl]
MTLFRCRDVLDMLSVMPGHAHTFLRRCVLYLYKATLSGQQEHALTLRHVPETAEGVSARGTLQRDVPAAGWVYQGSAKQWIERGCLGVTATLKREPASRSVPLASGERHRNAVAVRYEDFDNLCHQIVVFLNSFPPFITKDTHTQYCVLE